MADITSLDPAIDEAARKIIVLAADHLVNASRVPGQCMAIHGWNPDGDVDVEFPNAWRAMDWATEYHLRAVVDFRDSRQTTGKPVKSVMDTCVLTFSLYDYAKAFENYGPAIPGTLELFEEIRRTQPGHRPPQA